MQPAEKLMTRRVLAAFDCTLCTLLFLSGPPAPDPSAVFSFVVAPPQLTVDAPIPAPVEGQRKPKQSTTAWSPLLIAGQNELEACAMK